MILDLKMMKDNELAFATAAGNEMNPAPAPVALFDPDLNVSDKTADIDLQMHQLAGNTGNVLFLDPVRSQIRYDARITDLSEIGPDARTLILSMGNWLSPAIDMGEYALALERSSVERVVVMGAGAQAQCDTSEIQLQRGTRRFLDIIAERSVSIGVRGDFTATVLEKHGIHNVDVIGCPSVFMFGGAFRPRLTDGAPRLAVNTTWHGHYRDAIAELLAFGQNHDALFVEQSDKPLLHFSRDSVLTPEVNFRARFYSYNHRAAWRLLGWWRNRLVYFTDIPSWRKAMDDVDLVVGSRFHGAIVAILSGARALFLTMDTRTKELAEYFNLPHIRFQDFDSAEPLEYYYEKADPSFFLSTFVDRKARFQAFLLKNGLDLAPGFGDGVQVNPDALNDPISKRDDAMAIARLIADAEKKGMAMESRIEELQKRSTPLRSLDEGHRVDRSEFVIPYRERTGWTAPIQRLPWRKRQGVRDAYTHQPSPKPYDDRDLKDEWQKEVYLNAQRLAQLNEFKTIVDFGCGSGFKLMGVFADHQTVGVDIEPALSRLRKSYPAREWRDGSIIHPNLLDGDMVICSDVLEHLTEPDLLLEAMAVSPARAFVLSTPALEVLADRGRSPRLGPPTNPGHIYEWTTTEFRALVERHLSVAAHAIVNLTQATQMCIAVQKGTGVQNLKLADLICK